MYREALRAAWAEIHLPNLDYNIKSIRGRIGPDKKIIGVVKADGYGHGAYETAQVLMANNVNSFGVATLQEAITLRERGITGEVVLLGLTPDLYADCIAEYDITPVSCSFRNALAISKAANKAGKVIHGFLAVDTGMGRVGLQPDDPTAIDEAKRMASLENFKLKGLFSHFATADEPDKAYATDQEKKFLKFFYTLNAAGLRLSERTIANSAAVMEIPTSHYDAVRPGIIMYGRYPSADIDRSILSLKPVMSVKANIVQLKKVPPGTAISYGRSFTTQRESLIATVPLGYADGYARPLSNLAKGIVGGAFAPVAGTICMDICMFDVTDIPGVKLGDEVILMGSDGKNEVLAEDLAKATGTISYEILCSFGRLPKVYIR